MKILKKSLVMLLVIVTAFCFIGCDKRAEREEDFPVAGVYIEDYTGGRTYRYLIDNAEEARAILDKYLELEIVEDPDATVGAAYLLFRFYNEDVTQETLFTIYENGTCCIGRDYETLYTVEKGRTAYIDLATLYESSPSIIAAEDYTE